MTIIARFVLGAAALALAACGSADKPLDKSDPQAVAKAFMDAYKAEDYATFVSLLEPRSQEQGQDLVEKGKDSDLYGEVYNEDTRPYLAAYDGTVGELRKDGYDYAVIVVTLPEDNPDGLDPVFALDMSKPDGSWYVEDLFFLTGEEWADFEPADNPDSTEETKD